MARLNRSAAGIFGALCFAWLLLFPINRTPNAQAAPVAQAASVNVSSLGIASFNDGISCSRGKAGKLRKKTQRFVSLKVLFPAPSPAQTKIMKNAAARCRSLATTASLYVDGNLAKSCVGTTYNVGTRTCSAKKAAGVPGFRTFKEALLWAGPGDTLVVRGGRYPEGLTVGVGGVAGAPIVIRNFEGEAPRIDGEGVRSVGLVIRKSEVQVSGLTFVGHTGGAAGVIQVLGARSVALSSLHLANNATGVFIDGQSQGVLVERSIIADSGFGVRLGQDAGHLLRYLVFLRNEGPSVDVLGSGASDSNLIHHSVALQSGGFSAQVSSSRFVRNLAFACRSAGIAGAGAFQARGNLLVQCPVGAVVDASNVVSFDPASLGLSPRTDLSIDPMSIRQVRDRFTDVVAWLITTFRPASTSSLVDSGDDLGLGLLDILGNPVLGRADVGPFESGQGGTGGGSGSGGGGSSGGTVTPTPTVTATPTSTVAATPIVTPTPTPLGGAEPTPRPAVPSTTYTVFETLRALYEGPNPRQHGVTPGTIEARRIAGIRGKVLDRAGQPIPQVTISILSHPEFGTTESRASGLFEMAANGGERLVFQYRKAGFLPVDRAIEPTWRDVSVLPDVVMTALDPQATTVNLTALTQIAVAQGSIQSDSSGSRRATLMFKPGTTASIVLPSGAQQPISSLTVRATEYTVGPQGPAAMPASLPPLSAYTYAVELSVDEALALGSDRVAFNQAVPVYVENFLNFPVGMAVPVGYYDRAQGRWIASNNGRVIRILSISSGVAAVDVDGSNVPASTSQLTSLGIDAAELGVLGVRYAAGVTLWRTSVTHFTPWDHNWPFGPPVGARPPEMPSAQPEDEGEPDDPVCVAGSIIECESQVLREEIPLIGTAESLVYSSARVPGRLTGKTLRIPLSGAQLPSVVQGIHLEVEVAGQLYTQDFPPQANLTHTFQWNGLDLFGAPVNGSVSANVRIAYKYQGVYGQPAAVTQAFGALPVGMITGSMTRQEISIWQRNDVVLTNSEGQQTAIGGWNLSSHHLYSPQSSTLFAGDGSKTSKRSALGGRGVVITAAGNGQTSPTTSGVPAVSSSIVPGPIVAAPDGTVYVVDLARTYTQGSRIQAILPNGILQHIAGNGQAVDSGNGGPAIQAGISTIYALARQHDGALVLATDAGIRMIRANGIISTPYPLNLNNRVVSLAIEEDDSIITLGYCTGNFACMRRISPTGTITQIAGTPPASGSLADGVLAAQANLGIPGAIAIAPNGEILFGQTDTGQAWPNRLRKLSLAGRVSTIMGGTSLFPYPFCLAGQTAVTCSLEGSVNSLVIGREGEIYLGQYIDHSLWPPPFNFISSNNRKILPDGTVANFLNGNYLNSPLPNAPEYSLPVATATFLPSQGIAQLPDKTICVSDAVANRVRVVGPALPEFSAADLVVPDPSGTTVFTFAATGRHLATIHALTNAPIRQFAYDTAGHLASLVDADGTTTSVSYDGEGHAQTITAATGQVTHLSYDPNGFISRITMPGGDTYSYTYDSAGLMLTSIDPGGAVHQFGYDALGRLVSDQDPSGGSQVLSRVLQQGGLAVQRVTGLGRAYQYRVAKDASESVNRAVLLPGGRSRTSGLTSGGVRTTAAPSGVVTEVTLSPDRRFGMLSPIVSQYRVTLPSGAPFIAQQSRSAVLATATNPLSLISLVDQVSLNGLLHTRTYTRQTRTYNYLSPLGRSKMVTIDHAGRPTSFAEPLRDPVTHTYDTMGRLTRVAQGVGAAERAMVYSYNAQGYLDSITDPYGTVESRSYDAAGRLTTQVLGDGSDIVYQYDAAGRLGSLAPPGRPGHLFQYTPLGFESRYQPPAVGTPSPDTVFTYNIDRQLTDIQRPDGAVIHYGYDPVTAELLSVTSPVGQTNFSYSATSGLMISATAPSGHTSSYTYNGNLLLTDTSSAPAQGTVNYGYDNFFRIASVSINGANPASYGYDNDGLLSSITTPVVLSLTHDPQNGALTGTSILNSTDTYQYNSFGEVSDYSALIFGGQSLGAQYQYDKLGRIVQRTEQFNGATTVFNYTYDARGRLIAVAHNSNPYSSYTYDANGNRLTATTGATTITATYDNQDRLLTYGGTSYTYTNNGELRTKTDTTGTTTYDYDTYGNLLQAQLPGGMTIEYVVDARNRRIGKKVNGSYVERFLYDGQLRPVAQVDITGTVQARFVYGTHANVPDLIIKNGFTYRVFTDHLGSPRLVVRASTSGTGSGSIVQRMEYDEFGNVIQDSSPGFQPFGFAGGLYDRDTGLVRFGARDYDPVTGRWTAKDPIRFGGGDTNLYGYVVGDPVNFVDPEGESPVGWLVKLLENGGKRVLRPIFEVSEARALRRQGENVQAVCRQKARQIERGAFPGEPLMQHKGHKLPNGKRGEPHFQTEDRAGHTFWGGKGPAAGLLPFIFDLLNPLDPLYGDDPE